MKMFNCVLNGDNFIGIAICRDEVDAIRLGMKNCWGTRVTASLMKNKRYGARDLDEIKEEFFVNEEYIGNELAEDLGYKDVDHISLGIN